MKLPEPPSLLALPSLPSLLALFRLARDGGWHEMAAGAVSRARAQVTAGSERTDRTVRRPALSGHSLFV